MDWIGNQRWERFMTAETRMCPYNDGATAGVTVDTLVAQVEDQRSRAVKEPKHTNADIELCRGGVVTLEVAEALSVVTRNIIWMRSQSDGKKEKDRIS